jgi:ubiquinone/menaquinone biosynthesis C-methylase UbiE
VSSEIRFDDGAAYERYMGVWSRSAGERFLEWLDPKPGLEWLDVGCGSGAFTQLLFERCAPRAVCGVDPSEQLLAHARAHVGVGRARFERGDALALPGADASFDAAVMALVIFFVPDPARGVAEMARMVRPGGSVSAYAWDMENEGFPYEPLHAEMRALGIDVPTPPSRDASRLEVLAALWRAAGLQDIQTCTVTVQRTFTDFEEYWSIIRGGPSVATRLRATSDAERAQLKERMRARLRADASGRIASSGRANAIKGRVAR